MLSRLILKTGRALGLEGRFKRATAREVRKTFEGQRAAMEAAFRKSLDTEVGKLRTEFKRKLKQQKAALEQSNAELSKQTARALQRVKLLEEILITNDRDRELIVGLPQRLASEDLRRHVVERIKSAEVMAEPYPHIFVEQAFPEDFYELLIEAIPPLRFFSSRDPIKRNFSPRNAIAPAKSMMVWSFVDSVFSRETLLPAMTEKFQPFLDEYFATAFGPEFVERARALPQANTKGRLMCRRPGYKLGPHLDPKRVLLTTLIYLPRSAGEDERYGTQIFRGDRDFVARYSNTYYPEPDGIKCELAKTVPFRRNSLLVFLNSKAIHGADIPLEEPPKELERYAYQFYIGPETQALKELVDALPAERQAAWRQRNSVRSKKKPGDWNEEGVTLVERSSTGAPAAP